MGLLGARGVRAGGDGVTGGCRRGLVVAIGAAGALVASAAGAGRLADELGRNEVRIYARPHRITPGQRVVESSLPRRLDDLGYRRVHERPQSPGEYFWGFETFWVYRRASAEPRRRREAVLVRLDLDRASSRVARISVVDESGGLRRVTSIALEPMVLAESVHEERAPRRPLDLDRLPEHVWRAVLAIEDARFLSHEGVDPRSVARAMLKNALAGRVTQGGSTITQQLVKMRDLSPKRTMGRKVSEAVRALALEAEYDKREILTAYLEAVYLGHVEGVAVHGLGSAAEAYFSKPVEDLTLAEATLLAGMIQGPNRLHPLRHPEAARARQGAVLERLEKLGWAPAADIRRARRMGLPKLEPEPPAPRLDRQALAWVRDEIETVSPRRLVERRGFVVDTTIDPLVQRSAERAVAEGLARLRRGNRRLRQAPLSAALVALDAATGDVLAAVAGDPSARDDAFDRVRRARRQPGSAVKPFVLLEAFETCGSRAPIAPSRLVLDAPLEIALASGPWRPANPDERFRGPVTVRDATIESLNVPFVRIAAWCGFESTAARLRVAGVTVPEGTPPAFVLGAVETSPLELASAYTVFATLGDRLEPRLVSRIGTPSGRRLERRRPQRRSVVRPATAFLVRDLLRQAVERGTARSAALATAEAIGKTGTSSARRDAWFVGTGGSLVAAVWVGLDSGDPLGLSGAQAAAPIWAAFMKTAVEARPPWTVQRPRRIVERWIDVDSGFLRRGPGEGAELFLVRRGAEPPRRRPWRRSSPPVID